MTEPGTVAIAVLTLGVAVASAIAHLPRRPDLDAERWFKIILATLLRGRLEAEGKDAGQWAEEVTHRVPYHPLARQIEHKLADPAQAELPEPNLPGERALLNELASRGSPAERWRWLFHQDPRGLEIRLDDPIELGAAYDPRGLLGDQGSWDHLARWEAGNRDFVEALLERVDACWVLLGAPWQGHPDVRPELTDALGRWGRELDVPSGDPAGSGARLVSELTALAPKPGDRLVLVVQGEAVPAVLHALLSSPPLRDQVWGVVAVGGVVQGLPGTPGPLGEDALRPWLAEHFDAEALDTEIARETVYASMQWVAPSDLPLGLGGLPVSHARFPEPGQPELGGVRVLDLGVLSAEDPPPRNDVAKALVAAVGLQVLAHR